MKHFLNPLTPFPHPNHADDDGLLAIGGQLSPTRVFQAHCQGIFPWYENDALPLWWSPIRRGVLPCNEVHISRSLRRRMRKLDYLLTIDTDFAAIIHNCQHAHGDTWITPGIKQIYQELHWQGRAHSFELWVENKLVGGLYGVALDRVFCGESMFSLIPDASKIVLVLMCAYLSTRGITHLDCQFVTPHLSAMGAVEIDRQDYLQLLGGHADRLRGHWASHQPPPQ